MGTDLSCLSLIFNRPTIGSLTLTALRNEVDPSDPTDHSADAPMGLTIVALSALHVLCCGLPLLLLSGVSLTALLPNSPMIGGFLALVGVAGFVWCRKKRGATCPGRSERCRTEDIGSRRERSEDPLIIVGMSAAHTRQLT